MCVKQHHIGNSFEDDTLNFNAAVSLTKSHRWESDWLKVKLLYLYQAIWRTILSILFHLLWMMPHNVFLSEFLFCFVSVTSLQVFHFSYDFPVLCVHKFLLCSHHCLGSQLCILYMKAHYLWTHFIFLSFFLGGGEGELKFREVILVPRSMKISFLCIHTHKKWPASLQMAYSAI